MNPTRLIQIAKKQLAGIVGKKYRHVTVLVKQKKVISIGENRPLKTHKAAYANCPEFPFIHAELDAIIRAKNKSRIDFSACTLYNLRVGKSGRLLMARPCKHCQTLIRAANFKGVYYTNEFGLFERFLF